MPILPKPRVPIRKKLQQIGRLRKKVNWLRAEKKAYAQDWIEIAQALKKANPNARVPSKTVKQVTDTFGKAQNLLGAYDQLIQRENLKRGRGLRKAVRVAVGGPRLWKKLKIRAKQKAQKESYRYN